MSGRPRPRRTTPLSADEAEALSERVCNAASPFLFATDGSDVGRLVEAALECAAALLAATEAASTVTPGVSQVEQEQPGAAEVLLFEPVGRFVLFERLEDEDAYIASWDTWAEARAAFPILGDAILRDEVTGREWRAGDAYEREASAT